MTAQITTNGTTYTVTLDKGSYYQIELMKDEYMLLSFNHTELIPMKTGTTAVAGGHSGVLVEDYAPTYNQARGCYLYSVQFKADYWAKNNTLVKLLIEESDGQKDYGPIFDLTDTPARILAQICKSAGWTAGSCMPTEVVAMHFEGTHCVDALNQLCQACDANGFYEWWFEGNTVNIGKLGTDKQVTVELNEDNVSGISVSRNSAPAISKLYAYGSDKNLNARYGKSFSIDTSKAQKQILDDEGNVLGTGYYDPLHIITSSMFKQSAKLGVVTIDTCDGYQQEFNATLANQADALRMTMPFSTKMWIDASATLMFYANDLSQPDRPFVAVTVGITKLREKTDKVKKSDPNLDKLKDNLIITDNKTNKNTQDLDDVKGDVINVNNKLGDVEGTVSDHTSSISTLSARTGQIDTRSYLNEINIGDLQRRVSALESGRSAASPFSFMSLNETAEPVQFSAHAVPAASMGGISTLSADEEDRGDIGGDGAPDTEDREDPPNEPGGSIDIVWEEEYEDVKFDGVSMIGQVYLVGTNGRDSERIYVSSSAITVTNEESSVVSQTWTASRRLDLPSEFNFTARNGYTYRIEIELTNVSVPSLQDYVVTVNYRGMLVDIVINDPNMYDAGSGFGNYNPWGFPDDDERSRVFEGAAQGLPQNIITGRCPTSWFTAPSDYAGYIISGSPRLRLPEGAIGTDGVEGMIIFEDIYPSMSGTLGRDLAYDAFEEKDTENMPTGRWLKYYSFTTSLLPASLSSDDLTGETMHIVFTSGRLNGMDFELKIMGNADGVCKLCIIPNEDYSALVPNDTLKPDIGDTYKLYNVDACLYMEGDPIREAEAKLRVAAQTYLRRQLEDTGVYNCNIKPTMADSLLSVLTFGGGASLAFGGASLTGTRVIGYKYYLDLPAAALEVMVGNSTPYRKLDYLEKKINNNN